MTIPEILLAQTFVNDVRNVGSNAIQYFPSFNSGLCLSIMLGLKDKKVISSSFMNTEMNLTTCTEKPIVLQRLVTKTAFWCQQRPQSLYISETSYSFKFYTIGSC